MDILKKAEKGFQKAGVNPEKVGEFLVKALLTRAKFNAADPKTRAKMLKTAIRTYLPFPFSLAAGEILVQLKKKFKPLRDAIANGI